MSIPNVPDAIFDLSYLPNLALRVVGLAAECLETTPLGAPASSGLYWGPQPADCCDSLAVWLETIYPASKQGGFAEESGPTRCGVVSVAQLGLRLWRSCWPTVKDNAWSPFPVSSETTVAAANLMMDAIAIECCLISDLGLGVNSVILGGTPLLGRLNRMNRPGNPLGGCVGMEWALFFELGSCCVGT